jgi:hypothetical protein
MVRRKARSSWPRVAAAAILAVALLGASVGTSTAATGRHPGLATTGLPGLSSPRAAGASVNVTSSVLKVVSSTGHRLRIRLRAFQSDTSSQVDLQVETRDGAEEHDWSFDVPRSGVSISSKGTGRVRLTSGRSAGYATVSLKATPHGRAVLSTCHSKTASKTRHVSLSGTLRLSTRSTGRHAWGRVGSLHKKVHFSTHSSVTWIRPAASSCSETTLPCRNTFAWQASSDVTDELDFLTSVNKGAHARITGARFVNLPRPAGATRTDILNQPQSSPNQLIVNTTDGSATLQATFRGGTATLSAPQPATTQVLRCATGKKKISVDFWPAGFADGATPIRLPAQIFGAVSLQDNPAGAIYRITVQH